jgi:hypothetical protein
MSVQYLPYPLYKAFANNGTPLAGGLLYTYISNTTTPQATYTDNTGSTPNTNPVVLNARGEAPVWLTVGQSYTTVLQDSNGNTISTQNGVTSGSVQPILTGIVLTTESRNNTTTLSNSQYLSVYLTALGTYEFILNVGFTTVASAGFACNVNYSGTIVSSGGIGYLAGGSNTSPGAGLVFPNVAQVSSTVNSAVISLAGGTNTALQALNLSGTITVSTPGTLAFAFAQASAESGNTSIVVGSYGKITFIP